MDSWRFLLSRRWLLFALAVAAFVAGTVWLGNWQFDRLVERQDKNGIIRDNEDRDPSAVDEVLAVGRPVADTDQWRLITATGTYAVEDSVVVRYRNRDGASGIDVVVPLVTSSGTAVLVDRGFVQTDPNGTDREAIPSPPGGEVTITGWVRQDGEGDSTAVAKQSTRAISSARIGEALSRDVYGGFVDLRDENGAPPPGLVTTELPDLGNGPHFFYGLQWWFFGVLGVFGFGYLAYDERRHGPRGQRPRRSPPSTGNMTPVTYDAAGESRNAAARPNSTGSP